MRLSYNLCACNQGCTISIPTWAQVGAQMGIQFHHFVLQISLSQMSCFVLFNSLDWRPLRGASGGQQGGFFTFPRLQMNWLYSTALSSQEDDSYIGPSRLVIQSAFYYKIYKSITENSHAKKGICIIQLKEQRQHDFKRVHILYAACNMQAL